DEPEGAGGRIRRRRPRHPGGGLERPVPRLGPAYLPLPRRPGEAELRHRVPLRRGSRGPLGGRADALGASAFRPVAAYSLSMDEAHAMAPPLAPRARI